MLLATPKALDGLRCPHKLRSDTLARNTNI